MPLFRVSLNRKAGNVPGFDSMLKTDMVPGRRAPTAMPRQSAPGGWDRGDMLGSPPRRRIEVEDPGHRGGALTTAERHGCERGEQRWLVENIKEIRLLADPPGDIRRQVVPEQLFAERQPGIATFGSRILRW